MNASAGCGCSARSAGGLLALFVALLLIFVTLTIAGAAAFVFFSAIPATKGGAAIPALLIVAIVLLGLVLLLLLLLLWCCCRGKANFADLSRFLKLLPSLRNAGAALEASAVALNGLAIALRAAKAPVSAAGNAMRSAGEQTDISIPTVSARTKNLAGFGDVVVGLDFGSTSPLHETSLKLLTVGDKLSGQEGLSNDLEDGAVRCDEAAAGLRALKTALDAL
jgi:hypothetical protein